ncbi:MAG: energy-coupling factor transporter transmembrane component T [Bifidobacterium sp.]|nr:energy-coupling factor transporter transmembrane component T [Bifidobacterium sp.]
MTAVDRTVGRPARGTADAAHPHALAGAPADASAVDRAACPVLASRGRLYLDPRTKLFMLVCANLLMFLHAAPAVQAAAAVLFAVLMLTGGRPAMGVRMLAAYGALALAELAATALSTTHQWLQVVGVACAGLAMMMPCLIAGMSAFCTTRPGDFVCAMRRMRVPTAVVIPVVVLMRFFPTIAHDFRQIRHAQRLRGLAGGAWRDPAGALERTLVPLLMNATTVAQDLTVAALAKGLGTDGPVTSLAQLRLRPRDWAAMALCALPVALAVAL